MVNVDCTDSYVLEKFSTTLTLDEFYDKYVDIPKVGKLCTLCKNYGKSWECPPHTEDIRAYWKKFKNIQVIAIKLNYTDEFRKNPYTSEELQYIVKNTLHKERKKLKEKLYELEDVLDGEHLYGGRCDLCEVCAIRTNEPCRFPTLRRYSLESIGSNLQKATYDLFDFRLQWVMKDMKLPEYFCSITAVVY